MTTNELYEIFEQMKDAMGADTLLENLYRAMTTREAEENLRYIARMWDMEVFNK